MASATRSAGIRLSQMDVPIAVHSGTNSGPGACTRWGYTLEFDAQTLATLYPTHAGYVSEVSDVDDRNVLEGFLLAPDAESTLEEAAQSDVPEPDAWVAGLVAGVALASLRATGTGSRHATQSLPSRISSTGSRRPTMPR